MKKRCVLPGVLFVFLAAVGFSQTIRLPDVRDQERAVQQGVQGAPTVPQVAGEQLDPEVIRLLAISSSLYPVTPGDVYTLSFRIRGESVSYELLVESDYTVNLDVLGEFDVKKMRFQELKPLIEGQISKSYSQSFPSLQITSVGIFQVPVTGEVPDVQYQLAWGLTRLSELVEGNLASYSSIRDIRIRSKNGEIKTYDLQLAFNRNRLDQNPLIEPGDTVIIGRVSRVISVEGGVYRPGDYQLLKDEGITELEAFFNGYKAQANLKRIKVVRVSGDRPVTKYVTIQEIHDDFELYDGDTITVSLKTANQPVVFIEGGISPDIDLETADDVDSAVEGYNRVTLPISVGDTLYDALYRVQNSISPFASLSNGYISRETVDGQEKIHVDMEKLLYNYDLSRDVELKPFDTIAIPLRRPFVSVVGAVNDPGRYPYSPPEEYSHYINLAGGVDTVRNSNNKVIVKKEDGTTRPLDEPVQPGDTIQVLENDFLYNYNTFMPAITTGLTLITSIITLIVALSQ
jgi:polysaccharide biosynthesis/export protein